MFIERSFRLEPSHGEDVLVRHASEVEKGSAMQEVVSWLQETFSSKKNAGDQLFVLRHSVWSIVIASADCSSIDGILTSGYRSYT